MDIETEIQALYQKGIEIDHDLYVTLQMCLIASQHTLLYSTHPNNTLSEAIFILTSLWGLTNIHALHLTATSSFDLVREFQVSRDLRHQHRQQQEELTSEMTRTTVSESVVFITGLENSTKEFQSKLQKFMHVMDPTSFFLVVPIIKRLEENDNLPRFSTTFKGINKYLKDRFWFCQEHVSPLVPPNISMALQNEHFEDIGATPIVCDFNVSKLSFLRSKAHQVELIRDIKSYIYDIVIFGRLHRMVSGGIPTFLIESMHLFLKVYAAVNNYDYVIPEMVKVAAKKLLPLHINILSDPNDEPTLLYGSDVRLVRQVINKWNEELVVEDIVNKVQPPV
ncbi:unnamed protein product [Ambrosiozyma monospora]|uniref:Unnamed protein product n=1 Tax=Ambrosiozyma monospora TaxID=43982 RepID=A0A9W6SXB0_AMBMO|nr:unnamed protein product [Ambrosiozyma monospora]